MKTYGAWIRKEWVGKKVKEGEEYLAKIQNNAPDDLRMAREIMIRITGVGAFENDTQWINWTAVYPTDVADGKGWLILVLKK